MTLFPEKLSIKLAERKASGNYRVLPLPKNGIDFSSNDYLGLADSNEVKKKANEILIQKGIKHNGATGSRLLTGNHGLYAELEELLCDFHQCEAALVFNSGYDANIGFFSSVPQRGDLVFYDELIHASIRDGIQMGHAKNFKFRHNDLDYLREGINRVDTQYPDADIYVVTESVFSMDGDSPYLKELAAFCASNGYYLVVDEAHAVGVMGENGEGMVQQLELRYKVFARIVTFGKALGSHGAVVLGTSELKEYLVNFSRSFIYTTGLSPHTVASTIVAHQLLKTDSGNRKMLLGLISHFKEQSNAMGLKFIPSDSAIQCHVVPGNQTVRQLASKLLENGFDVRPILSPTVPKGQERLRFCLHSFNTKEEVKEVLTLLSQEIQRV